MATLVSAEQIYAELARTHQLEDPNMDWQVMGLCGDADQIDLWSSIDKNEKRRARAVCRECPVINDCMEFALTNNIQDGIWGGQSPNGRKRIAAARAKRANA